MWIKLHLLSQNAGQKYWFLCNWPNIFSTFAPINGIFTLLYEKIYQILRDCRHYFRSALIRTSCHPPLQWQRTPFRWIGTGLKWCCNICKGRTFNLFSIFKWGRKEGLTTVVSVKGTTIIELFSRQEIFIYVNKNIYFHEEK